MVVDFKNAFVIHKTEHLPDQRTEAGPCQRHGEGGHGDRAEVKDFGIDVQWGQCLNQSRESFISTSVI